jgi:hypothetical protein
MQAIILLAAALLLLAGRPAWSINLMNHFGGPRGFGTLSLDRSDNGSSGPLSLPFPVEFYGVKYNIFYINTNGSITFQGPFSEPIPSALASAPQPILAPWWGNVDTRHADSGLVWYSINSNMVAITWDQVGYHDQQVDLRNSFQLLLHRPLSAPSGFFIADYRYQALQWSRSSASGSQAAQAGYGSGVAGRGSFSLPGSGTDQALNLVDLSNGNPQEPGLWQFRFSPVSISFPGSSADDPWPGSPTATGFEFMLSIFDPGQPMYIDPLYLDPSITVGYDYSITSPLGVLFQSVITPALDGNRAYDLYLSSNGCASNDLFAGVINAGVQHRFQQPLACFGIRGIDLGAAGSAGDPLAFVTGLTFNRAGFAQVIQTPITQSVPDSQVPGALPVLGMGAAFGWSRRLRRRITIRIDTTPPQPATLSMGGGRGGGHGS